MPVPCLMGSTLSSACLGSMGRQAEFICFLIAYIHVGKLVSMNPPCTGRYLAACDSACVTGCWQIMGDLGHSGDLKDSADGHKLVSWEGCIWKSLAAGQEGMSGSVQVWPFLCWWGRKDPLCQKQIYLDSFVLIRHVRPSFDLIYSINYPHCWSWNCTKCKTVLFSIFFHFNC